MKLRDVEFEVPKTTQEEAEARLEVLLRTAQSEANQKGEVWREGDKKNVAAFYFASAEFLGELTPGRVAWWFRRFLKIQATDGRMVPFVMNVVQFDLCCDLVEDLKAGTPPRYVILKARQFGISTFVQGFFFFFMLWSPNTKELTVAHKDDASRNVYEMMRRFVAFMPYPPLLKRNSMEEMAFDSCENIISIDTAKNTEVKRSFNFQLIHMSELAFWPYAPLTKLSVMQTIHYVPGTIHIEESTANGVGGTFYEDFWRAERGESRYTAKFYPWFLHPDYVSPLTEKQRERLMRRLDDVEIAGMKRFGWTLEQIQWRRHTIIEKCDGDEQKFRQEYPSYPREAFLVSGQPVFDLELVERRRAEAESSELYFRGFIEYAEGSYGVPLEN